MNRKFHWIILLFALILLLSACGNGQNPEKEPSEPTGSATQGTEEPNQNTTPDPTIPSGYKEQTNFGFGIAHTEGAPKKGQRIAIETTLTNISGQVYTYTGGYSYFIPGVRLYCVVDGKEYVINHDPIPGTDDTGTYHVPAGESRMQIYYFNIPEDAPNGNYHLQVSYYPESVIFENIFTLSE